MLINKYIVMGSLLIGSSSLFAQKKPVDHTVYDAWKSISSAKIAPSGNYIYYTVIPQEGDATIFLQEQAATAKGRKAKKTSAATPQNILEIPRGTNPFLTNDEQNFVSLIKAPFAAVRQAKIKKKKPEEMPKDSLAVYNILAQKLTKFGQIKSVKTSDKNANYFAFISTETPKVIAAADSTAKAVKKAKEINTLSIYNFQTGDTTNIAGVEDFYFSKTGNELIYVRKAVEKDTVAAYAGVYIYQLAGQQKKQISKGKGVYKSFSFDETSSQLAFLADKSPEKSLSKDFKLYYYTPGQDSASVLADRTSQGLPTNWEVSQYMEPVFSKNGDKLFLGLAPIPKLRDTTLVDFEHAKVDIWSWNEDYLYTQQIANKKRFESENFLAVMFPKQGNRITPLLTPEINQARLSETADEPYFLASSDHGRRISYQWDTDGTRDYYLVNSSTGEKKSILKDFSGNATLSLDGSYVLYFNKENNSWNTYHIATDIHTNLTDGIPVSFSDETHDSPSKAESYGFAGWSADSKGVYINDRYDIWYFDLAGKDKYISTNGAGRLNSTVFRYINIATESVPRAAVKIDPKSSYFVSSFNEVTKANGIYEVENRKNKNPKALLEGNYAYKQFSVNKDQSQAIYTKENYQESPNLFVSKNFKSEVALSDINPQQALYNWGTAELVKWTTPAGYDGEGILYKPEDFDPTKKYPIIAYFYEVLSDGLYNYQAPAPTPSRLNISYFVSNGYLVFAPDIHYKEGQPGKDAEEYINSGMQYLAKNSWVDASKMAVQGQSWGGYQVAHLITRTNMYAAAWSGAPVVNMTSAYGGIRWQSGMSRQFQYEKTQSRLGKTLWEDRERYIANSPLFFLDKVETPVVIMANDNDGAVPWYQGIEMFTGLRRLQKPAWLLNYNGDEHNLMLRQNRKDIQIRQQQFFDHFLKGKPAAKWIKSGVPYKEKGIDWGFDID